MADLPPGYVLIQPKTYTWRCLVLPEITIHVEEGRQPCRFHRWMQRLFFGVIWERLP